MNMFVLWVKWNEFLRHRIESTRMKRVALNDSSERKVGALKETVTFKSLKRILRARRVKTTSRTF